MEESKEITREELKYVISHILEFLQGEKDGLFNYLDSVESERVPFRFPIGNGGRYFLSMNSQKKDQLSLTLLNGVLAFKDEEVSVFQASFNNINLDSCVTLYCKDRIRGYSHKSNDCYGNLIQQKHLESEMFPENREGTRSIKSARLSKLEKELQSLMENLF